MKYIKAGPKAKAIVNKSGNTAVVGEPLREPGTGRNLWESAFCCAADCLKQARPMMMPIPKNMKAWRSQMTPHTCDGQHPHILENAAASEVFTFRAMVSSIISHSTYMQDITPINKTRYLKATPPATNQNSTNNPAMKNRSTHVKKFLLAQKRVIKKNPANTRLAILLALVLNPQAINAAPMSDEPRYPAGSVIHGIPPDMLVAPPSSGSSSMLWIRAQVITPANA